MLIYMKTTSIILFSIPRHYPIIYQKINGPREDYLAGQAMEQVIQNIK